MNNIVEIIYNKSERYPQLAINGEKISRYMELADLIYNDIFAWADKFYESMDDELCESYTLQLTGHPFHYRVLKALQPQSQYCTNIVFTPLEYKIPAADRLAYAQELNAQYRLNIPISADSILFGTDDAQRFSELVSVSDNETNYYITANHEVPDNCGKYCIILSEQLRFEKRQGVFFLNVPEHLLPELVDYLNLYHRHLEFITTVFSAAGDLKMDPEARLKYEAYFYEEYRIFVGTLPDTMDTGERLELTYTYYPQQFEDPQISAGTNNPGVLFISDNTLIAQSAGVANVVLTDKFGTNRGFHSITVIHHNYVNNISIVLPATSLQLNETISFKCLISPNDAEDIDSVRYTISDPSVAAFSGQHEIYGIAPGRVKITISTPRVSRSAYLTVLPKVTDVLLPNTELDMPLFADAYVNCCISPANASPVPTISWQSNNPRVVRVLESTGDTCKITSLSYGTAYLTCSLNGTDIRKTMRIDVVKEKGCYVATAVYGSYDCPQVWVLRRYRDQYLASRAFGRAFIKFYYALSPTAVRLFGKTKWFNRLWLRVLDSKIRKLKAHGYEDTPYND